MEKDKSLSTILDFLGQCLQAPWRECEGRRACIGYSCLCNFTADWEISPGLHLRFSRTSKKRFKGRIFGCDLGRKVTKKKITTAASFN